METLLEKPGKEGVSSTPVSPRKKKNGLGPWYQWHRKTGIIVLVPIIMWCVSGLMHPIMARWFKVEIPNRFITFPALQAGDFEVSLQEVLLKNGIASMGNVNVVLMDDQRYYQVQPADRQEEIQYFSTKDGTKLADGDAVYAAYLARYFIEEWSADIRQIERVIDYTGEYKFINRLLPVYKVSFDRPDAMDVYVHTASSRLGTANDKSRKVFLWLFSTLHNWDFFAFAGPVRPVLMTLLLALIFLSAVSGLYIYAMGWKRFRKQAITNSRLQKRKWHRSLGVAISLVALTFSFSGAYHLLHKKDPKTLHKFTDNVEIHPGDLIIDPVSRFKALEYPVANFSLVVFEGQTYYRFAHWGPQRNKVSYLSSTRGELLQNGDSKYAKYLAKKFSGLEDANISSVAQITKFRGEYGFVNKRLPVQKVSYDTRDNAAYYIETSTGKLASVVTDPDRWEGFSFAFLHKYHTLDFAGKDFRDAIMSLAALGLLVVSLFGLMLYLKK